MVRLWLMALRLHLRTLYQMDNIKSRLSVIRIPPLRMYTLWISLEAALQRSTNGQLQSSLSWQIWPTQSKVLSRFRASTKEIIHLSTFAVPLNQLFRLTPIGSRLKKMQMVFKSYRTRRVTQIRSELMILSSVLTINSSHQTKKLKASWLWKMTK